jgi:hypothetical protein
MKWREGVLMPPFIGLEEEGSRRAADSGECSLKAMVF